jgi:hypothetical protein
MIWNYFKFWCDYPGSRASTRETCTGRHSPAPLAVGIPRSFSPAAMARRLVALLACSSVGARSAARSFARVCTEAARDIARRLSGIGAKHSSGKAITYRQIAKWREKVTAELASENQAAARYALALQMAAGRESSDAVTLMLDTLTDLSPANFPKKPPA